MEPYIRLYKISKYNFRRNEFMSNEIIILFRSIIAFALALIVARFLGRKLISQMTFFDFVVSVTLGTLTASVALGSDYLPADAITSIIVFALLAYFIGVLTISSIKAKKIFDSEPVVVIANGNINNENMEKIRYNVDSMLMHLRQKNVFNVADVEFAILEPDGKLSVELKSQKRPVTPSDINIPTKYEGLLTELVIDGNIMVENLNKANLNREWLDNELKNKGITSYENVFFAGLDTLGNMFISLKFNHTSEKSDQYGIE